ncbi:hypothetical protein D1872_264180 [compost metagenome]
MLYTRITSASNEGAYNDILLPCVLIKQHIVYSKKRHIQRSAMLLSHRSQAFSDHFVNRERVHPPFKSHHRRPGIVTGHFQNRQS